jgi:transcription elongation factor GreA
MSDVRYYTEEGLQNLKDELHELKTKGRADMAKQIAEARDKGDLSENAEYDAAKDAQGLMEMRIAELEGLVGNARVRKQEDVDLSKVSILSTVKIKNVKNGMEVKYTLVSEKEADLKSGKISYESPIGKGLLNKKIGEVAEVQVPAGMMEFEILDITLE